MKKKGRARWKKVVAASKPQPSPRTFWLLALALAAATLVAYSPALNGRPIWDDERHMTPVEMSSLHSLGEMWFRVGSTPQYYPLVHTVFWLERQMFGDAVFPHHFLNLVLHVASALLLVRLLRELAVPGAWLAGAVFALHPVHVESVAWISELKNTLSGLLYLSAAWHYLKFDKDRNRGSYLIALGFFVLGLLSKSVIASLPAALLVIFWWRRGALSWRRDVWPLLPFFVVGISAGLFTAWVERHLIGAEGSAFSFSFVERCLIAGRAFWFYLAKLLWPVNLIFTYPRWHVSPSVPWQYVFPFAALLFFAALVWLQRWSRAPLAAFLFFAGTLFPVLGFVNVYPFIYSFVADHFQYLASIGVIALFAAGLTTILQRRAGRLHAVQYVVPSVIVVSLGLLTFQQAHVYADAETLYRSTLARNADSWMAHNNLGIELAARGEVRDAISHYEQALKIEPHNPQAYTNLANAFMLEGRAQDAIADYEKTLELAPDSIQPKNNLAWLLVTSRDPKLRDSQRGLALAEDAAKSSHRRDPVILRTLAAAYAQNGRFREAAAVAEEGVRLAHDHPEWASKLENEAKRYRAGVPPVR